nr:MAG TPA: hypothetical protein [Herelleviridae sp.]
MIFDSSCIYLCFPPEFLVKPMENQITKSSGCVSSNYPKIIPSLSKNSYWLYFTLVKRFRHRKSRQVFCLPA